MSQPSPKVVILKTGSTYPDIKEQFGDFDEWFVRGLSPGLDITVLNTAAGELPGDPADWDGIVMTGSAAMVSDREPWSEKAAAWLAQAVEKAVPLLGVCYGHQLLAHALGGEVGYHPGGRESGTRRVELLANAQNDPLLCGMPGSFSAQLTHRQSVLRLPLDAVLLGRNEFEPHQAFRVGKCAWGVQFHPEFSEAIMRAYLGVQAPDLEREGFDSQTMMDSVTDTPEASRLLERFSALVTENKKG
ncbi:GMP synthase (glutamine-hydrolysing) [Marinobacter antarcticus]|uniref:GMP synthase (Glutamine-hydrolysing) n=1 Tax=Marinobacter antarcticus TaxID=564117 RepID=A0A1M6V5K3_9GAMM|nr:glutamine amidotransferase [Marinobacter antarcticus]SHK76772.1 GMP synthase (glutamine-hydrolysing) [Marinobacter antarcticus]